MPGTYFVILTCRNSQDNIENAIHSLEDQTLPPEYVVIVDDGSTDHTPIILRHIQQNWNKVYIITHPDEGYDLRRVVKNWNDSLEFVRQNHLNETRYHMIAQDDSIYSKEYAKKIISYMDSNPKEAVVSGNYAESDAHKPHGTGRFVRNTFLGETRWKGQYPDRMGYESAILYEASAIGYKYSVLNDARFEHTRKLGMNHSFYEWGPCMRTMGYHPLYAFSRIFKILMTGKDYRRIAAITILYHYLTYKLQDLGYDSQYEKQFRDFVRHQQTERMKKICLKMFRKFFISSGDRKEE